MDDQDRILTTDEFKEQFKEKLDAAIAEGKETAKNTVKERFKLQTADKVWIAAAAIGVLVFRDRRSHKKIRELKKLVSLLNVENQFYNAFVNGLLDPKADKDQLVKELGTQFQFLSMVKDI